MKIIVNESYIFIVESNYAADQIALKAKEINAWKHD